MCKKLIYLIFFMLALGLAQGQDWNDYLVAHWPLDGDASDIVGGNDGVLEGEPSFVEGMIGSAIDLNGTNQTVSILHSSALKPESEITISAWVKPDDITTNRYYEIYRKEDGDDRHLLRLEARGPVRNKNAGDLLLSVRPAARYTLDSAYGGHLARGISYKYLAAVDDPFAVLEHCCSLARTRIGARIRLGEPE